MGSEMCIRDRFELYRDGVVTYETALAHADSANDLRLLIKLSADTNPELGVQEEALFSLQGEDDYLDEEDEEFRSL